MCFCPVRHTAVASDDTFVPVEETRVWDVESIRPESVTLRVDCGKSCEMHEVAQGCV
jgi:hypothetical protein